MKGKNTKLLYPSNTTMLIWSDELCWWRFIVFDRIYNCTWNIFYYYNNCVSYSLKKTEKCRTRLKVRIKFSIPRCVDYFTWYLFRTGKQTCTVRHGTGVPVVPHVALLYLSKYTLSRNPRVVPSRTCINTDITQVALLIRWKLSLFSREILRFKLWNNCFLT